MFSEKVMFFHSFKITSNFKMQKKQKAGQKIKPTDEQIRNLKPTPVDGLTSLDIDGVVNYIKTNHASNVIILIGAGMSCAAGIPDFRTPGTGLYYNLQKFNLPEPEAIFSIDYFRENPQPFFELAKETMPGKYKPTYAHYLPVILQRHNMLKRVYTQNIDGLERVAGVIPDKMVECHGTYFTAHCLNCKKQYELKDIQEQLEEGKVIKCTECKEGVVKPDIVFFGEGLPDRFFDLMDEDFAECDLLIIIGTSLQVSPVNSLPSLVKTSVPRVLINNKIVNTYKEDLKIEKDKDGNEKLSESFFAPDPNFYFKFNHALNRRDIFLGGDCQKSIQELIKKLGWEDEYDSIVPEETLQKMNETNE